MGFAFQGKASPLRLLVFEHVPLFKRGHSAEANNLLEGKVGAQEVMLLDYSYSERSGNGSTTYTQTVAILLEKTGLPEFSLAPENADHKVAQWFGYQDIDFPENESFSRGFLLRGPDEDAIRQAFRPNVLEWFVAHKGMSSECGGGYLILYRDKRLCKPDSHPEMAAMAAELAAVLMA